MELTDTHCHLHFDDYGPRAETAIKDAGLAGISRLICVGTNLADSQKAADFAAGHENVWATVGVHPHDAAGFLADSSARQELNRLIAREKIVAVGEIGLDYYRLHSPKAEQQQALETQLDIGRQSAKPFVFHVRDAWDDFWPIIDRHPGIKGVVHSFNAGPDHLDAVLSRGLHVALNGIMTFTEDKRQLEAAKLVPANRLLLETDAPFLAPKPFRGQVCEPKHTRDIASFLSELRGESLENLAATTTDNARKLFGI